VSLFRTFRSQRQSGNQSISERVSFGCEIANFDAVLDSDRVFLCCSDHACVISYICICDEDVPIMLCNEIDGN